MQNEETQNSKKKYEVDREFYDEFIEYIVKIQRLTDLARLFKYLFFEFVSDGMCPDNDEKLAKNFLYSLSEIIDEYSAVIYKQGREIEEKLIDFRGELIIGRYLV